MRERERRTYFRQQRRAGKEDGEIPSDEEDGESGDEMEGSEDNEDGNDLKSDKKKLQAEDIKENDEAVVSVDGTGSSEEEDELSDEQEEA